MYGVLGRYADAEALYKRSLTIAEKALGANHPDVARSLNNLVTQYLRQARYAEAEPLAKRAISIYEKALGPDHPYVATALDNLASLQVDQGRYIEAEPLRKRALAIRESALGHDHPDVATSLNNFAWLYFSQRDWPQAVKYWRRSTDLVIRRWQRGADTVGQGRTGKVEREAERRLGYMFSNLVKAAHRMPAGEGGIDNLASQMFQTAQWAQSSEAAASLAQMAARGATGNPKLAAIVRERQDLVAEWQKRDAARSTSVSLAPNKRDKQAEAANVVRLADIDTRVSEIDKQLAVDFPVYAALASPSHSQSRTFNPSFGMPKRWCCSSILWK